MVNQQSNSQTHNFLLDSIKWAHVHSKRFPEWWSLQNLVGLLTRSCLGIKIKRSIDLDRAEELFVPFYFNQIMLFRADRNKLPLIKAVCCKSLTAAQDTLTKEQLTQFTMVLWVGQRWDEIQETSQRGSRCCLRASGADVGPLSFTTSTLTLINLKRHLLVDSAGVWTTKKHQKIHGNSWWMISARLPSTLTQQQQ